MRTCSAMCTLWRHGRFHFIFDDFTNLICTRAYFTIVCILYFILIFMHIYAVTEFSLPYLCQTNKNMYLLLLLHQILFCRFICHKSWHKFSPNLLARRKHLHVYCVLPLKPNEPCRWEHTHVYTRLCVHFVSQHRCNQRKANTLAS